MDGIVGHFLCVKHPAEKLVGQSICWLGRESFLEQCTRFLHPALQQKRSRLTIIRIGDPVVGKERARAGEKDKEDA
jgi:hypothetical protein